MTAASELRCRHPTPDEFRSVIGSFASGVTVVTGTVAGEHFGTTVSAVSSVCLQPPTLLVCLNTESATCRAIGRSRLFAVNVLAEHQADLACRFATKGAGKFDCVRTRPGPYGLP